MPLDFWPVSGLSPARRSSHLDEGDPSVHDGIARAFPQADVVARAGAAAVIRDVRGPDVVRLPESPPCVEVDQRVKAASGHQPPATRRDERLPDGLDRAPSWLVQFEIDGIGSCQAAVAPERNLAREPAVRGGRRELVPVPALRRRAIEVFSATFV